MRKEPTEWRHIHSKVIQVEGPQTSGQPEALPLVPEMGDLMASVATQTTSAKRSARSSYSLPPRHQTALDEMSASTGLTKNELIRQAIGLLTIAVTARERGLVLALANDEDKVLSHIVSSL
jgi:hypothetical protein